MNTGAMTGADAPALRALAGHMSQSATRLDAMRQNVRARLYSINWQGPDGANFRRAWDGQHAPMLSRVAEGLRASAQNLLREAAQQEDASGVRGGSVRGPALGVLGERVDARGVDLEALKRLLIVAGGSQKLVELALKQYRVKVGDYLDDAKWVERFDRWVDEHLTPLRRRLSNVDELTDDVGKIGKLLPVVGGVLAGVDQWQEDQDAEKRDGEFRAGEQEARAVVAGGAMIALDAMLDATLVAGGTAAGASVGAAAGGLVGAVGGAIGGPAGAFIGGMGGAATGAAVGAVAGGMLGYAASTVTSMRLEDPLTDVAAWSVSRAYDVGEFVFDSGQAVVDYGGRVLDASEDLLEASGQLADEAGEAAGSFLRAVNPWGPR